MQVLTRPSLGTEKESYNGQLPSRLRDPVLMECSCAPESEIFHRTHMA